MSTSGLDFPSPAPMMKRTRPVGVIVAAIVLALIAAQGLLTAASSIFVAVAIHNPETSRYPVIAAFQIGFGIVVLLISVFCAWTVVGLFRLRRWARYSVIVFGGALAVFSTLFAILFLAMSFNPAISAPNASGMPPTTMRIISLVMAGFFLFVTLIGIWWLVYFNLRHVREIFLRSGALALTPLESVVNSGFPRSGIEPGGGVIGVLVTCVAVLYLLTAASGVVMALLRFPLFFLGFTFRGLAASLLSIAFAALGLGLGIGLLRHIKSAWAVALAFQIFGMISSLLLLLPGYRSRFGDYQIELSRRLFSWMSFPPQTATQPMQGPAYFAGFVFAFLLGGAVFWLLIRARPLFGTKDAT